MEYEITPGKKVNSKLLYTSDKHLFQKTSDNKTISYYNCFVKECKARLKVDQSTSLCSYVFGASRHIHGVQEYTYKLLKVDNTMKVRSSTEKKRPREIFDEERVRNPEASVNMQFAKRHRTLKYHQHKGIPPNPKTLAEVKAFFENQEIVDKIGKSLNDTDTEPYLFYQETVIEPTFAYVIFSSEAILSDLPDIRSIRIDCTFKCVPKSPFNQLLILQTDFLKHSFPGFFVLMTRKTEEAYAHLLKNIETRWKIGPTKATTDYERALKNALIKQYPGIELVSCWFHFCQALAKYAKQIKGLRRFIKDNDNARKVYHKLMCLPLMQANIIRAAFQILKEEALQINKNQFIPFLSYIEKQWLQREGPKSISVFQQDERTNNPMESFNSSLNSKIPAKGCFYKFVSSLRDEEFNKSRDYNIIRNGGSQLYHDQRKEYIEKNEKIFLMQDQFEKGKLSIKQFFDRAADLYEKDLDVDEDEDEEVYGNDAEEEYDEKCGNCHIRMKEIMFQPCYHIKFCRECADTLIEPNPKCPECNALVTGRVLVFLWYF